MFRDKIDQIIFSMPRQGINASFETRIFYKKNKRKEKYEEKYNKNTLYFGSLFLHIFFLFSAANFCPSRSIVLMSRGIKQEPHLHFKVSHLLM